jgi:hypothetical protein
VIYAAVLVIPVVIDDLQLRHFVEQSSKEKIMKPQIFTFHHSGVTVAEVTWGITISILYAA